MPRPDTARSVRAVASVLRAAARAVWWRWRRPRRRGQRGPSTVTRRWRRPPAERRRRDRVAGALFVERGWTSGRVAPPRRRPGRGPARRSGPDAPRRPPAIREATVEVPAAPSTAGRSRHHRLGTARRGAADRRRQPARRVEVPVRGPRRGAAAGAADARALVAGETGDASRRVWVPVFTRGRFDVLDEATSPFNLLADAERCTPSPTCPPMARFIRHEPAAIAAHVARRRPPERHHRPRRLGGRRLQRLSGLRAHLGRRRSACRPARRRTPFPPVLVFETIRASP